MMNIIGYLQKTLSIIIILSVPMVVGVWSVSHNLLTLLYGDEYFMSASVLKILSLMVWFIFII